MPKTKWDELRIKLLPIHQEEAKLVAEQFKETQLCKIYTGEIEAVLGLENKASREESIRIILSRLFAQGVIIGEHENA